MEAIAKTRHLKGSPRKARLVIDLIRGRNVSQALNILKFTDKRAAEPIEKTLRSAIANATYLSEQQNIAVDPDDLFVKTCFVDMGAHKNRRRMRPAPQGRAFREQRHYCHITILVSSEIPKAIEEANAKKASANAKKVQNNDKKNKESAKSAKTEKTQESLAEVNNSKVEIAKDSVVEQTRGETPIVETPIVSDPVAEMMETKVTPEAKESAENDAKVADAKNVESQTSATLNETKKADEAQLNENDILEINERKG